MILLFFTLSIFAISANAVSPLISTMAESTGIGVSNFGVFIFIQFMAFSLAAFAGGYIKEKLKISNYFLISAGLAIIVICLAQGAVFLNSYISLIIWVIPLGFSAGPVWPVLVMISLSVFRSEKRTAILIGTGAIGFAVGQLIGSVLISFKSIRIYHHAQLYFSVIVLSFVCTAFLLNRSKYQLN